MAKQCNKILRESISHMAVFVPFTMFCDQNSTNTSYIDLQMSLQMSCTDFSCTVVCLCQCHADSDLSVCRGWRRQATWISHRHVYRNSVAEAARFDSDGCAS